MLALSAVIGGDMAKLGTILVVGGGVAGLTTAAALHRHGFMTELVERQQAWRALGAGFLVQPNGMRMLGSLGLAAGVENAGAVVRRWQFCDEQGNVLSEIDLETLWGDTGPCVGIERPNLQRALLPGVANVRCRLGTSVISLEQDDRRVSVDLAACWAKPVQGRTYAASRPEIGQTATPAAGCQVSDNPSASNKRPT
jgi:2-polyprenyl-6-methoxyphenol hydroxylase-like FAD-dependent oxidoreductase